MKSQQFEVKLDLGLTEQEAKLMTDILMHAIYPEYLYNQNNPILPDYSYNQNNDYLSYNLLGNY